MKHFLSALILSALICGSLQAGEPVLVVNQGVEVSSLNPKAVRYIFLGKKTSWDGEGRIVPAALNGGDVHKTFLRTYMKKTPSQFTTHWKRMTFTGKAEEIRTFSSEAALLDFVAKTPGAVGYISNSRDADGAKKVSVQ